MAWRVEGKDASHLARRTEALSRPIQTKRHKSEQLRILSSPRLFHQTAFLTLLLAHLLWSTRQIFFHKALGFLYCLHQGLHCNLLPHLVLMLVMRAFVKQRRRHLPTRLRGDFTIAGIDSPSHCFCSSNTCVALNEASRVLCQ